MAEEFPKIDISSLPDEGSGYPEIDLSELPDAAPVKPTDTTYADQAVKAFSEAKGKPFARDYVMDLVATSEATGLHPDVLMDNQGALSAKIAGIGSPHKIFSDPEKRRLYVPDLDKASLGLFTGEMGKPDLQHSVDVISEFGKYRDKASGYMGLQGVWDAEARSQLDKYDLPSEFFASPLHIKDALGPELPAFLKGLGISEKRFEALTKANIPLPISAEDIMRDRTYVDRIRGVLYDSPESIPGPELTAGRAAGAIKEGAKKTARDTVIGFKAEIDAARRSDYGVAIQLPMLPGAEETLWPKATREQAKQQMEELSSFLGGVADKLEADPEYLQSSGFVEDLLRQTPQVAGQIVTYLSARGAIKGLAAITKLKDLAATAGTAGALTSGAGMFQQIVGGTYDELLAAGVPEDRALAAAIFNASAQTPLEQFGLGKMVKNFVPGKPIGQVLFNVAESFGSELITEALQEYPEEIAKIYAKNADEATLDKIGKFIQGLDKTTKDALYSGLVGGVLGGGTATVGGAISIGMDRRAKQKEFTDFLGQLETRLKKAGQEAAGPAKEGSEALAPAGGAPAGPVATNEGRTKLPIGYKIPEGRTIEQETDLVVQAMGYAESGNRDLKPLDNWGQYGGRFQFQTDTWKAYSSEYNKATYGDDSVLPMSPENQLEVTRFKVRQWLEQGYSPKQIYAIWNSGKPNWIGKVGFNARTKEHYNTPRHVERADRAYQAFAAGKTKVPIGREEVVKTIASHSNFSQDQVDRVMTVMDAAAGSWAEAYGKTPDQWYGTVFSDVEVGGEYVSGLPQSAFHGSPYRFDKFSLEHIGSGEGAQSFGHGLYFASSKDVAEWYRERLSDPTFLFLGRKIDQFVPDNVPQYQHLTPQEKAAIMLANHGKDKEGAIKALELDLEYVRNGEDIAEYEDRKRLIRFYENSIKAMEGIDPKDVELQKGQLYGVDIPDDTNLMAWDKTIGDQPEKVLNSLLDAGIVKYEKMPLSFEDWSQKYKAEMDSEGITSDAAKQESYRTYISNLLPVKTGRQLYESLVDSTGSRRGASETLRSIGVVGHSYPEGSISGGGKGGNNYVIYDDEAVKILETFYQSAPKSVTVIDQNQLEDMGVDYGSTEIQRSGALSDLDRYDPGTNAATEAAEQVAILDRLRLPSGKQTIVTIKEAQDWLESNGYPRIAPAGAAVATIEKLLKDPAFQKLSIFDRIRVAAQVERPIRNKDYSSLQKPKANKKLAGQQGLRIKKNQKVAGSGILAGDTVAGCDHFCYECYALKGSQQGAISHQYPVLRMLYGTLREGETFRDGEIGDPSRNWQHTHEQVAALIERSRAAGNEVTPDGNVFYVTKLQNVLGFHPETASNLQVTLDPMYPDHMKRSMENILRIKAAYPKVNIAVRVRSFATRNEDLRESQAAALDFANRFGLSVLETRMRFIRKASFELLELEEERYKYDGSQFKLQGSPLYKDQSDNFFLCDEKGGGCPKCLNCIKTTTAGRKSLKRQNAAMKREGVEGLRIEDTKWFDPTGGSKLFQVADNSKGAVEFLQDGKAILHLFEKADVSTVIHELGHILRRQLSGEDLATIEGWAGVSNGKWTRQSEEKFARAFERYVMEGKAPSLRLRSVFATLRKWLIEIYQSVKTLNVEMPDEVRGVFDRLLSTESQRQADVLYQLDDEYSWVDPAADPIPLEDIQEYEQLQAEAARRAHVELDREVEKDRKKREGIWRKEALAQYKEEPLPQLVEYIKKHGGLSLESVSNNFGKDMVREIQLRYPGLLKEGGKNSLDELAADYGYEGDDALASELLNAPTRNEYVDSYLENMRQESATDDEYEVALWYGRYLDAEVRILNELMGKTTKDWENVPRKGIKKFIEKATGQTRVGDAMLGKTDPDYRALKGAMKMAARNAAIAFREGKKDGALKQKMAQKELALKMRIRLEARKEVAKIKRDLNRWLRDKKVDYEYSEQLRELLAPYELKGRSARTQRRLESLREFIARKEAEGDPVDIPADLIERLQKKPIGTLTLDELRQLHDAAGQIVHLGKLKKQLVDRKRKRDFDAVLQKVIGQIISKAGTVAAKPAGVLTPSTYRKSGVAALFDKADSFHTELLQPEFLIRLLDGFEEMGPAYQELFLPVKHAEDEKWQLLEQAAKVWDEIRAPLKDAMKTWGKTMVTIPGMGRDLTLTKEEQLMVALHARHSDNHKALMNGNRFDAAEIQAIVDSLSIEEKAFLDGIVNKLIPIPRDLLQDTHRKLHGSPLKMVQGDYVPMKFDRKLSSFIEERRSEAEAANYFKDFFPALYMEKGMTMERKGGVQPLLLSFSALLEHLSDTIQFATHGLPVRNLLKILNQPAFKDAVKLAHGENVLNQFKPWLKEVASPGARPLLPMEGVLRHIRRNAVFFTLGFRLSTALQQPLALMQTMDELGVGATLDTARKYLSNYRKWSSFILDKSKALKNRNQSYERDLQEGLAGFAVERSDFREAMEKAAFALTGWTDGLVAQISWLAAYEQAINGKVENVPLGSEEKAVDYADGVVSRTQGTGLPKNLSMMLRGTEIHKLFITFFMTFANTYHNRMWESYQKLRMPGYDYNFLDGLKALTLLTIIPALLSAVVSGDDFEDPGKDAAKAISRYMFSGIPLARDAMSVISGFPYRGGLIGSIMSEVGALGSALTSEKKDKAWRVLKHTLKLSGYGFGFPPDQALLLLEAAMEPKNKHFTLGDLVSRKAHKE